MTNRRSPPLKWTRVACSVLAIFLLLPAARAGINVPSDGSDGVFSPTANIEVDLSQAVTGTWSDNNTANAGKGIYDPVKWAVVFKYSSVNIPSGVTVTFKNHPSGAPVVWLVQTDATISGTVNLNGKNGDSLGLLTEGGPGGSPGGGGITATHTAGCGHGPGGGGSLTGGNSMVGGGYGTKGTVFGQGIAGPVYGNPAIQPLIGGSGGTGLLGNFTDDGGAGGGALLICAGSSVSVYGALRAMGGISKAGVIGGSGGAIRIVTDTVNGNGGLYANGVGSLGVGGSGRIRIEANTISYTGTCTPAPTTSQPETEPVIWPPASIPAITITHIGGAPAPVDPDAVLTNPDHYATVDVSPTTPITVRMSATNVPETWNVVLRVVPYYGADTNVTATKISGDASASVWEATITAGMGISALQARASKP